MSRGFTLIEMLMVIAITAVLLSLVLFMSMDVFRGTTFRSTEQVLVSALTTARSRALANLFHSTSGVCYRAPDFIIFTGATYESTNPKNERIPGNPSVTLTSAGDFFNCMGAGATGIIFSQIAATTSNTGSITISASDHPDTNVSVNSEGTIIW